MARLSHIIVCATLVLLVPTVGQTDTASDVLAKDQILELLRSREYSDAAAAARRLLRDSENKFGSDSLEAAEALQLIAQAMAEGHLGGKAERLHAAERALAIRRRLFDQSGPEVADGRYWVGFVHYFSGDVKSAVGNYEAALNIAKAYYGELHPELERYTREYGASLYLLEHYEEAKAAFEELYRLTLDKYGPGTSGMVKALFNLALVHKVLNDLDESERLYLEVVEIIETQQPRDDRLLAQALDSYANLLSWRGRLEAALATNNRVLQLRRKTDGPESISVAGTLTNRARILEFVGDYEEAQAFLEESLTILGGASEAPGLLASTRVNLAVILRLQGFHGQSRKLFASAREVMPDGYPMHRWHREYATLLAETGNNAGARSQLQLAAQSLVETVGTGHVDYGSALAAIGALRYREGNLQAAREQLETALEILEDQIGRYHPVYSSALDNLAVVYRALNEQKLAFDTGLEAESLSLAMIRATLSVLPERIALAQSAKGHKGRDVAVSLALTPNADGDMRTRAVDALVRSRAVVFDEITSRNRFYAEQANAKLGALTEQLRLARTRLASLFIMGPSENPAQYAHLLRLTRREVERLEETLARESREFRLAAAVRSFGLDELIELLPKGTVLVSFVQYDRYGPTNAPGEPSYLAAVVHPRKPVPSMIDLGPASEIDRAVEAWRGELNPRSVVAAGADAAGYRSVGKALRRLIWDPVARHVGSASMVLVVPDGSINLVSFASLPLNEPGYLVEKGTTLHYLTAERDLARREAPPSKGRLMLVGNPAFQHADALVAVSSRPGPSAFRGSSPVCRGFESQLFSSLPGTEGEVRAVESIWKRSKAGSEAIRLSGPDASESAVRAEAPGSRVLHFATHGFYLGGDCVPATRTRGIGGLSARKTPRPRVMNPLLLSGIVLAGANRRHGHDAQSQDDGILTAEEISTLPLGSVELTVLSACRSGSGSVAEGEGVFGLRRAFLVAGSATVVSNLWDVDDSSAQNWVARFYELRFGSGLSVPEAVRGATIGALEARRAAGQSTHPFYWGGWLAAGGVN